MQFVISICVCITFVAQIPKEENWLGILAQSFAAAVWLSVAISILRGY